MVNEWLVDGESWLIWWLINMLVNDGYGLSMVVKSWFIVDSHELMMNDVIDDGWFMM